VRYPGGDRDRMIGSYEMALVADPQIELTFKDNQHLVEFVVAVQRSTCAGFEHAIARRTRDAMLLPSQRETPIPSTPRDFGSLVIGNYRHPVILRLLIKSLSRFVE